MPQALSRRPVTEEVRFWSQGSSWWFCGERSGNGPGFCQQNCSVTLPVPFCQCSIPPFTYCISLMLLAA